MSDPAILIGFGDYGLRVMRNFLSNSAARGVLNWDTETAVGALNERRLRHLSLFWIPSRTTRDGIGQDRVRDSNNYELMNDLLEQIQVMDGNFTEIRDNLSARVVAEKTRLLEARRHGETRTPGLDIFLIAQPESQDSLGMIRNVTEPFMLRLNADPTFETAQQNRRLHFIEVLDFEDYWSPTKAPVRMALRRMVEEGSDPTSKRPPFSRIFLFDGSTPAGIRSSESRLQEVVLLLEFMLLESVRSMPDGPKFFEPPSSGSSPVCTIGIRAIERSSGILRRLAAAFFARGWLDYFSGEDNAGDVQKSLESLLEPFRGQRIVEIINEDVLRSAARSEVAAIERKMLDYAAVDQGGNWARTLETFAVAATESSLLRISQENSNRSATAARVVLKKFRDTFETTISHAMQTANPAVTLESMIKALHGLEHEFVEAAKLEEPVKQTAASSDKAFDDVIDMQREYELYLQRQVKVGELKVRWWRRFAIFAALAFYPVLLDGLASLIGVVNLWVWALVSAAVVGVLFWIATQTLLQAPLADAAERGREFYTEPELGRIAERIRHAAHSPLVEGRIERHTSQIIHGLRQYVLGAVADEMRRARLTLTERKREVRWLRGQVREFLRSNQVEDQGELPRFQDGLIPSEVCRSLVDNADLAAVARSKPRTPDTFRQMLQYEKLFSDWADEYKGRFLYPLQFLDNLLRYFDDTLETDTQDRQRRAREVVQFLNHGAMVHPCFNLLAADKLSVSEHGSLVPQAWQDMPGLQSALINSSYPDAHKMVMEDAERLYLYQLMQGVPPSLLTEASPQKSGAHA